VKRIIQNTITGNFAELLSMLKLSPVARSVKAPPPSDVRRRNRRPRNIENGCSSSDSTRKYAGMLKSALAAPKAMRSLRESMLFCCGVALGLRCAVVKKLV